jgi:hypothetical protein
MGSENSKQQKLAPALTEDEQRKLMEKEINKAI